MAINRRKKSEYEEAYGERPDIDYSDLSEYDREESDEDCDDDIYDDEEIEEFCDDVYDEEGNGVVCDQCGSEMGWKDGNYICTGCGQIMTRQKFFNHIGADIPGKECLTCDNLYPGCICCKYGYSEYDRD